MRKFGAYSLLVAALLLTGCSEKNVEINTNDGVNNKTTAPAVKNSEAVLNTMPDVKEEVLNGDYSLLETNSKGSFYKLNGNKVFIKNVYFGFDKYDLTGSMTDVVNANAEKIVEMNTSIVKLSGHTDEWGSDEYNTALGLKRAKTVKDILVNQGVEESKISLISLGETNPVCTEKNSTCWQKNRRVEHTLIK